MTDRPRPAAIAALLSFLFPGLGQVYLGERRAALLFAGSIAVVAVGAIIAAVVRGEQLLNELLSAPVLLGLVVANMVLLAWRLGASLLPLITGPDIKRVVLGYPEVVDPPLEPLVNYLLIPRRSDVRFEMQRLFGRELEGWYLGSEVEGPPQDGT